MTQKIFWNQARTFSGEEWGLITRYARSVAQNHREELTVDFNARGHFSFNGRAEEQGDPFVLSRDGEGVERSCETLGHPYARHVIGILAFASKVAPDALSSTRERSPLEKQRNNYRAAFRNACQDFALQPEASIEETAACYAEQLGCDLETVALPAVTEAHRRIVNERYLPCLFAGKPLRMQVWLRSAGDDGTWRIIESAAAEDFEVGAADQVRASLRDYEARHLSEVERATLDMDALGYICDPHDRVLATAVGDGIRLDRDFLRAHRDRVNRENPVDVQGPPETGDLARLLCGQEAEGKLLGDSTCDLNALVEDAMFYVRAGRASARLGVQDAIRRTTDHTFLVEEIRTLRDNLAASQEGCRGMGSRLGPGFSLSPQSEMKPEYHYGTLIARAMGEWDIAFIIAERALTNQEDFFKLAAMADQVMYEASQAPPQEGDGNPAEEYPCVMYRQEQNRRAYAYQLVGEYARWKEAVREFTGILADLGERQRGRVQDGAIFGRLDTFLRGNGREPWDGSSAASVVDAVNRMAQLSEIICHFNVGGERAVSRDYLNMLELAAELELHSPEEITGSEAFKRLNLEARGTDKTAAEMLEDIHDELTGATMLGEATSQDLSIGFTQFQAQATEDRPPGTPGRRGGRR